MKKAVIDIGSNSVLLLIGERRADGSVEVELDRATVTRLSRGAAATGELAPASIEATLGCLREYARVVKEAGLAAHLRCVATEGVRMASNAEDFLAPASEALGQPVEIIGGSREAELSYLSVALEQPDVDDLRVIDIGGASTELVVGSGAAPQSIESHQIGSVRLTEMFVRHDPIGKDELAEIEGAARAALETQPLSPSPCLHGLAGTVTTAAALMLNLPSYDRDAVDGTRFERSTVAALRDRLAAQTIAERASHPCIGAGRADVIVTGVTILLVAMAHCGAHSLVVRDRGLRYALL